MLLNSFSIHYCSCMIFAICTLISIQLSTGELTEEYLREIMTTMGDRWTHDMVDELLYGIPIKEGKFDYIEFTRVLKHGAKEKDEKDEKNEAQPAPAPVQR